ncbi:hypothetical protein [Microbacterium sp. KR10-403]|uniref:hypothetical protein n=1 Tax=Microbacterium sp. KR10-403 TaxID=3158581 RepID=UPI0032E4AD90
MAHFRSLSAAGIVAAGLVLAGCASGGLFGGSAEGSCVAPEASPSPARAAPGGTISLEGRYFAPCNDTNAHTDPPWTSVDLVWVQNGQTTPLTTTRPTDDLGELHVDITVPVDAPPGDASVRVIMPDIYGSLDIPVTVAPAP